MVKTRIGEHARVTREKVNKVITQIFGKTMTRRRVTETVDTFGQLSNISNSDTTFTGDLQYGSFLDERLLKAGFVEHGDAVLYIHPDALSTAIEEQDIIIEGDTSTAGTYSAWEVIEQIEAPTLQGTRVFQSYRCKHRDDVTVT